MDVIDVLQISMGFGIERDRNGRTDD